MRVLAIQNFPQKIPVNYDIALTFLQRLEGCTSFDMFSIKNGNRHYKYL